MELFLTIIIICAYALTLSLRYLFGKDSEVCKLGCSNIKIFSNFEGCPICGETSEKHLTKTTK